ncbi:peptidoglycan-binding domain-containing protein [uncultured Dokdonia sp.]|uniref:peptidoglycan-binding domain-containing protein n=1 Tax=uncultured Dokdonia sp. TaxID=575653 RepID=UPI00261AE31B|nr:peptidoglycan-binding domain-containing protein [uncultured Dokdonia sp.]
MKEQINETQTPPNSSTQLLVVGGIILVLAVGGFTWYYFSKKKKESTPSLDDDILDADVFSTPPFRPISNSNTSSNSSSSSSSSSSIYIKKGSRHPDVKILQRYLKYYKEPLGRSGPKRDGVDGIFGNLTAKGAQKQLGKTSFTRSDIQSMKNTLKLLGI